MKTLITLSLVQTGILLVLLGKIMISEQDTTVVGHVEQSALVNESFDDPATDQNATAIYYVADDQLRQIIREELAAHMVGAPGPDEKTDAVTASDSVDKIENQYQQEQVAQQLEYHTSVGSISDADMQMLQMEIAKLDEAGRKEMLSKLVRALNSGRLDGHL